MGRGSSGLEGKVLGGEYATITEKKVRELEDLGASRWTKGDRDRLYLNGVGDVAVGLEIETYKTGNIQSAFLDGERISNSLARDIRSSYQTAYLDLKSGRLYGVGGNQRVAEQIEKLRSFIDRYRRRR